MSKKQVLKQPRERRHVEICSGLFLSGAILSELDPDERDVWVKFLCIASSNSGNVECISRDQLACQLCIDRDLLDRSIDKFIEFGAVESVFLEEERKEIFHVVKWIGYQTNGKKNKETEYGIDDEESRFENLQECDVDNQLLVDERINEENTLQNKIREGNSDIDSEEDDICAKKLSEDSISPIEYSYHQLLCQDEILTMLSNCLDYPFDFVADERLIKKMISRFPEMDHIAVVSRLIEWWNINPLPLFDYDPRDTLEIWIQKEAFDS